MSRASLLAAGLLAAASSAGEPWHVRAAGFDACRDAKPARKIRVAVVDDGFRLHDPVLAPFFRDGLDLADGDPSPVPPRGAEAAFWHGTYLSGVVADVFLRCFGDRAAEALEIVPLKVVEDLDPELRFEKGYAGLAAAARLAPDVVILAWSGGRPPDSAQAVLSRLRRRGTMVFASAGNRGSDRPEAPSALSDVVAVGEIDSTGARPRRANHGRHVLLLGPGTGVVGRASTEDRWITLDQGASSAATAWVAALYGVALARGAARPADVLAAMVAAAEPPGSAWDRPGSGGAGLARLPRSKGEVPPSGETLAGLLRPGSRTRNLSSNRQDLLGLLLRPESGCEGLDLRVTTATGARHQVHVQPGTADSLLVGSSSAAVEAKGGGTKCLVRWNFLVQDSSTAFCSGERVLVGDSGVFEDGSGDAPYAPRSDCGYRVKVPEGSWVRLSFEALQTQEGVDFLHVFAGRQRLQERLVAMYSGDSLPAPLVVPSSEVLLWFVTDDRGSGRGFRVSWRAVAPTAPAGPNLEKPRELLPQ